MKKTFFYYFTLVPCACIVSLSLWASPLRMEAGASLQYFPQNANPDSQENYALDTSAYIGFEYAGEFADGKIKVMVDARALYNPRDARRSRADFSELALGYFNDHLDVTAGILTEFWGVTESRHLVDIINQTNLAENIDEETKLGQPMIKAQWHQAWGNLQFYWLPIFRERIYPGDEARLGPGDAIAYDNAVYQSSAKDQHQDFALRYTHSMGAWDIGVARFKGTSREPLLQVNLAQLPAIFFIPYYEQIDQHSIDIQMTGDSLLLKLEAISRSSNLQGTYQAAVTGLEYTRVGILDTAMDLGYIAEYLYDERRDQATTPFADDSFAGLRLVVNDIAQTTYLLGAYIDRKNDSSAWRFEMNTRLQDGLTLSLEGQVFASQPADDLLYGLRNDDYLSLGLQWFF